MNSVYSSLFFQFPSQSVWIFCCPTCSSKSATVSMHDGLKWEKKIKKPQLPSHDLFSFVVQQFRSGCRHSKLYSVICLSPTICQVRFFCFHSFHNNLPFLAFCRGCVLTLRKLSTWAQLMQMPPNSLFFVCVFRKGFKRVHEIHLTDS